MQETNDGGYILAGRTYVGHHGNQSDRDFLLIKVDDSGNLEWTQQIGGIGDDRCEEVKQTDDGGYILAGYTDSYGAGDYDVWLVKTDGYGNTLWDQTYGGALVDKGFSLLIRDNGFVIGGHTYSYGEGQSDVYLIYTDPNGTEILSQTVGGAERDESEAILAVGGNSLVISGHSWLNGGTTRALYLAKVTPQLFPADSFSAFAYNSIKFGTGCTVESGDVAVTHETPGPHLSSLGQLVLGEYVNGHDDVAFKGDSLHIKYGTTIYDAYSNSLTNNGTIRNQNVGTLALPLGYNWPTSWVPVAGTETVYVLQNQLVVLQPGSYDKIKVYDGGNLIFEPGTYYMNTLYIPGDNCVVRFRGPTELNINLRMITDVGLNLGPESAAVSIKDIRINVHYASPSPTYKEAVRFGPNALIKAVVNAPFGTIKVKDGCTLEGTLIARDIHIWDYVLLRLGM